MVGAHGFEPWTNGLKGRCSTAELYPRRDDALVRTTGAHLTLTGAIDQPYPRISTDNESGPEYPPPESRRDAVDMHRNARMPRLRHPRCNRTR